MSSFPAIIIGLVTSVLIAWKVFKVKKPKNTPDYFLSEERVSIGNYVESSVAYGFQIAVLTLFATWGFDYGFWCFWVVLFWGLGYLLFGSIAKTKVFRNYLEEDSGMSVFSYIEKSFGIKRLALMYSILASIGLAGTAFVEAESVSQVMVDQLFGDAGSEYALYGLFSFFIIAITLYIYRGGFRSVVLSDKDQLKAGLVCFVIYISAVFLIQAELSNVVPASIVLLAIGVLFFLASAMSNLKKIKLEKGSMAHMFWSGVICVMTITILLVTVGSDQLSTQLFVDGIAVFGSAARISEIGVMGGLTLINLLIANSLWQVVDISAWQRVKSIENDGIDEDNSLIRNIQFSGLYSCVTWTIAIMFGIGLRILFVGEEFSGWTIFGDSAGVVAQAGGMLSILALTSLMVSMLVVMFSTVDSIFAAVSYNVFSSISKNIEKEDVKSARRVTIYVVAIFSIVYIFTRLNTSDIAEVLYAFYSTQLCILVPVVAWIVGYRPHGISVYVSAVVGLLASIILLIYGGDIYNTYTFGAIVVVVSSGFVFAMIELVIRLLGRREIS